MATAQKPILGHPLASSHPSAKKFFPPETTMPLRRQPARAVTTHNPAVKSATGNKPLSTVTLHDPNPTAKPPANNGGGGQRGGYRRHGTPSMATIAIILVVVYLVFRK